MLIKLLSYTKENIKGPLSHTKKHFKFANVGISEKYRKSVFFGNHIS